MSKPAGHTPLDDLISGRPASTRQRRIIWIVVFVALIALAVLLPVLQMNKGIVP